MATAMPGRWPAQAVLACGGALDGKRILISRLPTRPRIANFGVDLVLNNPVNFGMGYGLANPNMPLPPGMCYWGGWGGSLILVDQDRRVTVSFVMNRMVSTLMGILAP